MRIHRHRLVLVPLLVLCVGLALHGQPVIKQQGYLPFADAPIHYRSEALADPIARLQKRLESGEVHLQYEAKHGYLTAVLDALHVPVSSQTLVFSKTSFQYPYISPEKPRALYYNDDVYVGQVQHGNFLEFVSFDPMQGAIFYIMDEQRAEQPRFERAEVDCVQCHVAASTRGVPGVMLRSVSTRPSGVQVGGTPSFITGQESPFKDRWGGWYVTGLEGKPAFEASAYLTDSSDVVAHLVLAHQTQMHNLITQTNYQTRLALSSDNPEAARSKWEKPAEQLVRYLLFTNEAPIEGTIDTGSAFAAEFPSRGPRDSLGRSVRDFDLHKRIFKYPCSYLIYSEAFDSIPEPAKSFVNRRLFEVLNGSEQGPEFASLSTEDRRAILEILVATKPNVPEEWKQFVKENTQSTAARVNRQHDHTERE
jgi:hypothetical protein